MRITAGATQRKAISRPAAARRSPSVLVANARAVGWEGEGKVAYVHEKAKETLAWLESAGREKKVTFRAGVGQKNVVTRTELL